ncbi:hypothetical protein BDN67DRAFT_969944 [Paxillus ammoniavirescens]|nr:hypothetical protein BDN67DRAFT_969944 [Paxillus ammoniavirescens]
MDDPGTVTRVRWQSPITHTQQHQPAILPSHPAVSHEFQAYNHRHDNTNISFAPPQLPSMSQSQPQPQASFPPGAGPNDPAEQHSHYPPGHAYRRSHSNSPFRHTSHPSPYPIPSTTPSQLPPMSQALSPNDLKPENFYTPTSTELYNQALASSSAAGAEGSGHYASSSGVPRLPPILQVEKKQVTTSATQAASASRRRNEAHFICPVPGCGSTFTRRFNLRGHLRSHTEERPYVCEYPDCKKGFARQHDCKRHQALHATRSQSNICQGCRKTFSRLDALNRHLRSEGGAECRQAVEAIQQAQAQAQAQSHAPVHAQPQTHVQGPSTQSTSGNPPSPNSQPGPSTRITPPLS